MLLNVIFSPFPQPLSFFSSCLPSLHSISFFSNPPTLGEFHGHCDLPPNPTLLPNHINLIEQVDSTEEKETKIHVAPWRCQVECKNAEYRQTSSVAHESSCEAWEPSYCYSTSVTPRPIKAEKHIPKIQGKSCFSGGSVVKNLPTNIGDTGDAGSTIPGSGRSPGVGNSTSLQYSCL